MDVIRTEKLSFKYPEKNIGIYNIDLTVKKGEFLFVNGPSGSGKSTLTRCISGLIPHLYAGEYHGDVWVQGEKVRDTPLWELSTKTGLVFQNPAVQLISPTVEDEIIFGLENLGLERGEIEIRLEEVLRHFNLEDRRFQQTCTLSGGEKQKLALASITARKPEILVLDEPLSMLDTTAAFEFLDHLQMLSSSGITIILSEHKHVFLKKIPGIRMFQVNGNGQEQQTTIQNESMPQPKFEAAGKSRKIILDKVSMSAGDTPLFTDVNMEITAGKVTAFIGRNGTGKTTLFRSMAGFHPYEGNILLSESAEKPRLGMVFQNPDLQLFNASVREEILYKVDQPDEKRYQWLLRILGLTGYEDRAPLLLSEGEKRRVALATILMHDPEHGLVLDEPALGQDDHHKMILQRLLRYLADEGKFVCFSTHDIELALSADEVILIGLNGEMIISTPEQLKKDASLWQMLDLVKPGWVI